MIKVGQKWKRRDGEVVKIEIDESPSKLGFAFTCSKGHGYREDGTWDLDNKFSTEYDLVELIEDAPQAASDFIAQQEVTRRAEKYIADAQQKQHGGNHYRKLKIQPIQYIEANGLGFHEGNVLKYITRWKDKNGVEDLRKAVHYLELLIQHAEREANDAHNLR